MMTRRGWWAAAVLLAVGMGMGCSEAGPKSYRISGTVRLDGQPIPFGEVLFTPDDVVQNSGPQGIAEIHDGKYDTRSTGGKGIAGGPTVIRITGLSGPGGKLLCEYELKADLPRADTTHDIEVPKTPPTRPAKEI
jgi:hypothetical protein